MNPLDTLLTHSPFPEIAAALRSQAEQITVEWDLSVRAAMPQMRHLTLAELRDHTPQILAAMADALASDDPGAIRELLRCAPSQGTSRFDLNFDVVEVMQEDRLLRAIVVEHVEDALGRQMEVGESAALHAAIDVMLQRSVIALVERQKLQLRAAAEAELKFLSYLSHDLNNNLGGVTLSLDTLEGDLRRAGGFAEAEEGLRTARQAIADTVAGMQHMLQHERLRKAGDAKPFTPVDLYASVANATAQFARAAAAKGVTIAPEVPPGTLVDSDAELIGLVLQNLVGNAVKYSSGGTVRIGADHARGPSGVALWVSDEGPGIAPQQVGYIFEAFRRGDVHGQGGVGLGLAIASQAAKLLGAALTVESRVGAGTTFFLWLPADRRKAAG